MEERSNNTLTANEFRNDRDTIEANAAFVEDATTEDEQSVISPPSRTISRRKLTVFVTIAVFVGVIILIILIPALGLRKNA